MAVSVVTICRMGNDAAMQSGGHHGSYRKFVFAAFGGGARVRAEHAGRVQQRPQPVQQVRGGPDGRRRRPGALGPGGPQPAQRVHQRAAGQPGLPGDDYGAQSGRRAVVFRLPGPQRPHQRRPHRKPGLAAGGPHRAQVHLGGGSQAAAGGRGRHRHAGGPPRRQYAGSPVRHRDARHRNGQPQCAGH